MTLNIMRKQEFKTMMKEQYGIKRVWYKHLTHVFTKLYSMCRYWFRGSASLIIMMGINWIFGVLLFHERLLPLVYVFSITTALQVSVIIKLADLYYLSCRVFGFLLSSLCFQHRFVPQD